MENTVMERVVVGLKQVCYTVAVRCPEPGWATMIKTRDGVGNRTLVATATPNGERDDLCARASQIVDVPVEPFSNSTMPGNPGVEATKGGAGVEIPARFKTQVTECADLNAPDSR